MPVPTLVPDLQVRLEMQPEELEGSFCRSCARASGVPAGSRISGSAATTSGSTTQSRATHRTSGQGCSELLRLGVAREGEVSCALSQSRRGGTSSHETEPGTRQLRTSGPIGRRRGFLESVMNYSHLTEAHNRAADCPFNVPFVEYRGVDRAAPARKVHNDVARGSAESSRATSLTGARCHRRTPRGVVGDR